MLLRLLHIILAISVFFSTTGLIVVQHFCKTELKNTAIFVDMSGCGDYDVKVHDCCKTVQSEIAVPKKGCCSSEAFYIKSDLITSALSEEKVDFEHLKLLKSAPESIIPPQPIFSSNLFSFQNYQAPVIVEDNQVLLQSFLC